MATKTLEIGSVSSGTLRTQDLLFAFYDELGHVDRKAAVAIRDEHEDLWDADPDEWTDEQQETAEWLVNETLFDALNERCAPFTYFSAHEGDGADFGVWISWDSIQDAEHDGTLLRLPAGDAWPRDLQQGVDYVLEVTDHGNCTLFDRLGRELWAIV